MPIDPYAPCPGGTGKKIKFCCPDLTTELDKIQRMLDGEQRAACLEYIDSLQGKFPDRACLLSVKAMLEAQLGHETKAEATLTAFRQKHPENPVALAEEATLAAEKQGGTTAVSLLQDALEKCIEEIPPQVYDALGVVAGALLADGHVIAARAHLALQIAMSAGKNQQPLQLLARINNSPNVPLLAKQDLPMLLPPDDALWAKSYATAVEPARHGAWRAAAGNLVELASKVGDWPTIWHNIAVLRTYLADTQAAVDAWRKYATQDIALDDAIEAEALAQLLDAQSADRVDLVTVTYPAKDAEALIARLASNPRMPQMPAELLRMSLTNPDEPPPKAAYWILDRAVPQSGRDLKLADVPRVVGHALLFGKQTDRPARLELTAYRPELAQAQTVVSEIAGDALDAAGPEEVDSSVSMVQQLLSANWRLPDDTPADVRTQLSREHRNEMLLDRWPELPLKLFGGKTAREVAADPAMRVKVLAAILVLELAINQSGSDLDLGAVRSKLGLPTPEPIQGGQVSAMALPLARLVRVEVAGLSDEALADLYRRAEHYRDLAALRKLALEALQRPTLEKELSRAEIYGTLAQLEPDTAQSINYLQKAREAAEAAKTSTAPWDLAELSLRIARGEVAEADRLLSHIRTEHIREPGVAQAMFQILSEAGIIGPDGRPTAAREQGGASIVVPQGAGAEPGKIWTPGDEPASSGKKSALWTPGME